MDGGKVAQEFARAGQAADGFNLAGEILGVAFFEALDLSRISGMADFAPETGKKK
jgi:hypothetical protein